MNDKSEAAYKAWETRRSNEKKARLSAIAKKAVATRLKNKRSAIAKKAWVTRKANE